MSENDTQTKLYDDSDNVQKKQTWYTVYNQLNWAISNMNFTFSYIHDFKTVKAGRKWKRDL